MNAFKSLATAFLIGWLLPWPAPHAWAQGQATSGNATQPRSIEPMEFIRLAHSSSSFQERAAKLAAGRETRPEVKSYAAAAADFRAGLLKRLETFAGERNMPVPSMKEFEHQVILENLEPLDFLALSRRYAEVQIQALDQELTVYRAASLGPNEEVKAFAAQVLPELQRQREEAQKMYEAIKP